MRISYFLLNWYYFVTEYGKEIVKKKPAFWGLDDGDKNICIQINTTQRYLYFNSQHVSYESFLKTIQLSIKSFLINASLSFTRHNLLPDASVTELLKNSSLS